MSALLLAALLAGAGPGPRPELDLEWAAPAPCPPQGEVELRVADLVGRPLVVGPDAALSAHATVERRGRRFFAEVKLAAGEAHELRRLQAEGCSALADAFAVMVALAVDAAPPPPPAPPPPLVTATASTATTAAPLPATPAPRVIRPRPARPRPPPPVAGWVGVEAAVSAHLALPDPGLGAGGAVAVAVGPWRGALGFVARGAGRVETEAGPTASLWAWAVTARACRRAALDGWGVAGCLGAEVGQLRGSAGGTAVGRGTAPWAWGLVGVEADLPLALGAEVVLRAELAVAGIRQGMAVELASGAELAVYDVPAVSAGLGFGVRWALLDLRQ